MTLTTSTGPGTTVKSQRYILLNDASPDRVQKELNERAEHGYRPIFMSTCSGQNCVTTTVILELIGAEHRR